MENYAVSANAIYYIQYILHMYKIVTLIVLCGDNRVHVS